MKKQKKIEKTKTTKKQSRQKVYELIDGERRYQDTIRPIVQDDNIPDSQKSVAEFLLFIEKHLRDAKAGIYAVDAELAMDEVRKIAALCVVAMENNFTPARIHPADVAERAEELRAQQFRKTRKRTSKKN